MADPWQAETVVDEELARALIRAQCPSVPADEVELVSAGWDYTVHRVDRSWAFRFPRREVVVEPLRRELRVLPLLAPILPAAVPEPVHVGRPSGPFPWPFYGARWLPGAEAAEIGDRLELAPQLGRFLRRLHDAPLRDLPPDGNRRADMATRVPKTRESLAAARPLWAPPPEVERVLAEAEALPPSEHAVAVCHGDLHFRQLLVDGDRLSGVVDWVDLCLSDPGIDLMVVYAFLPAEARPAFFAEYGPADPASLARARVLALNLSSTLASWARDQGNGRAEREAAASLDRAVSQ